MKKISVLLASLTLLVVGATLGYQFAITGHRISKSGATSIAISRATPSSENINFDKFWSVWDLVHREYFDPSKIVDSNLILGAVKGMVAAVGDPYTIFLDKDQQKVTEEDLSGSFSGVGMELGYKGTQLAVVSPLPGTPAEKAGILAGDLIIGLKDVAKNVDRSTDGISLPEAVSIIRGPKGTKITLALLREKNDKPIIVEVQRQDISVPSISLKFQGKNSDIAYIKISKFGSETKTEWNKAILEVLGKPGIKGMVLDVRNNPGGYLQASVDIATEFLEKGTLVVSEESGGIIKEQIKTEVQGRLLGEKVVVLINKGSASASEILSGALRDQKSYKLVGSTSFGKGTVQEPQSFSDGTGIHITIRKWLTPKGIWVHGKGLDPDVKVEDDLKTSADEQLDAAVKLIEK